MRENRPMFSSVGCLSCGYGFFSAGLSSKSWQSKLKSASGAAAASLALLMLGSGLSEKVIKASSMVRSRQCALNASYTRGYLSPTPETVSLLLLQPPTMTIAGQLAPRSDRLPRRFCVEL